MRGDKITNQQRKFVDEYFIHFNATKAAIAAGYKSKWAATNTDKLLKSTNVKEYIAEKEYVMKKDMEIRREDVINELIKIGFSNITDVAEWDKNHVNLIESKNIDKATIAAISEVTQTKDGVRVKMYDKQQALVNLGRHLGLFTDKVQHSGDVDNPIKVELKNKTLSKEELAEELKRRGLPSSIFGTDDDDSPDD